MDLITRFTEACCDGASPSLLEFLHPLTGAPLRALGQNPVKTLQVRDGQLLVDGSREGSALDIFDHLALKKGPGFFPAYIGYFSYGFARYLGLPCHEAPSPFPDAHLALYESGLMDEGGDALEDWAPDPMGLAPLTAQELSASISRHGFCSNVLRIQELIRSGLVYQVNLSLPFYFEAKSSDMPWLYRCMRHYNHSPFMGMMKHGDQWLLSGSPERLLALRDGELTTRPIAGTKRRECREELDLEKARALRLCPKENAEHAMLVDLLRNDLNRVALAGSVLVDEDRTVEFYSHVMHLVSNITCTTKEELGTVFGAIFPGGTITGAPKHEVMRAIANLEHEPRGPYTGSFGYISSGMGVDLNIIIRSILRSQDRTWINTGAGVTIDSNPDSEWREVKRKAQAIADILSGRIQPRPRRPDLKGPALRHPQPRLSTLNKRVLFIENRDSFSYNIVADIKAMGASVDIAPMGAKNIDSYSHLIIGPGPGHPEDLPELLEWVSLALKNNIITLGICLGHQAIGHYFGAPVRRLIHPVHGKGHKVRHFGRGLFSRLNESFTVGRYHSLALAHAPKDFAVDAYSDDDCIMAIRHESLPIFGIQFHPESYLSTKGQRLIHNFLTGAKS